MIFKNSDVVKMYEKGYSIDYIVNDFYKFKTKNDIQNHRFNGHYIITKKSITIEGARKEVEEIIINYLSSNCAK